MTFNVWYRLSEMLTKLNDPQTEQRFRPYVAQFITSLVKHCQLNDDLGRVCEMMSKYNIIPLSLSHTHSHTHTHTRTHTHARNTQYTQDELPDDKDEFAEFRCHVVEVVRDIVFIVGSVECFQSVSVASNKWVVTMSLLIVICYFMYSWSSMGCD